MEVHLLTDLEAPGKKKEQQKMSLGDFLTDSGQSPTPPDLHRSSAATQFYRFGKLSRTCILTRWQVSAVVLGRMRLRRLMVCAPP